MLGIVGLDTVEIKLHEVFAKGTLDWAFRTLVSGQGLGVQIVRNFSERAMFMAISSTAKKFRGKGSTDGTLDMFKA